MTDAPTLDFTCAQCGSRETFQLVPMEGGGHPSSPGGQGPALDFTCSSCGATDTYQLVPMRAAV